MILELNSPINLFRYDINEPSNEWDANEHSLKTEYASCNDLGHKNKAGYYFLYDNEITTKSIAKIACVKQDLNQFWLTRTETKEKITILDFSRCNCIHEMLDILDSVNIYIYRPEIKINGYEHRDFSEFVNHRHSTKIIQSLPDLIEVGWFGQLLTDFDNWVIFKYALEDIGLDIDGYRWCESINPYGLTYCLFKSDNLKNPKTECIEL